MTIQQHWLMEISYAKQSNTNMAKNHQPQRLKVKNRSDDKEEGMERGE